MIQLTTSAQDTMLVLMVNLRLVSDSSSFSIHLSICFKDNSLIRLQSKSQWTNHIMPMYVSEKCLLKMKISSAIGESRIIHLTSYAIAILYGSRLAEFNDIH